MDRMWEHQTKSGGKKGRKQTNKQKKKQSHVIWLHTVFSAQLWEGLGGLATNWSVVVLLRRHCDQLLGGFGDVVGALDDLLCDQLDVGRAGAVLHRLLALTMEPAGTGREQEQGPSHGLWGRPLLVRGGRKNKMRGDDRG